MDYLQDLNRYIDIDRKIDPTAAVEISIGSELR